MTMKILTGIVLGLALSAFGAQAEEKGVLPWGADLAQGLAQAKQDGKPVVVDFSASWCGWCKKLEQDTFPDPGVQDLLGRYVRVRVDADTHPELVTQYGVKGLPTLLLLDSSGRTIRRVDGFRGAERLAQELRMGLAGDATPSAPLPTPKGGDRPPAQQGDMENPLPAMAEQMSKVKVRLESEETGKGTQEMQEQLLAQLEEMIKQAEQQEGG
jgi:thioredoxin-like negative regulator of GroEL